MINPKVLLSVALTFISTFCLSQTVHVTKESMRIKNENADGYSIVLSGSDINNSFVKYLKGLGKVKQGFDYHTLTGANIGGKLYAANIYASAKDNDNKGTAWIGIKNSEWSKEEAEAVDKQLEKIVYDFGVQFYRGKIQNQIDESTHALQTAERQQQKFINQNRDLNTRLEDNKRQKIQLEKSLVDNKLENENLLKSIEKNKKDQDSLRIVNEQIKKVIEMQKQKQQEVK
jgi:hypothetical protein